MQRQTENAALVHAIVAQRGPGPGAGAVVLALPGSDYRMDLSVAPGLVSRLPDVGAIVRGVVHGRAAKVEVVRSGGRYIEPLYGRPRHAQGMVRAIDRQANTLTVQSACPLVCTLAAGQRAGDFAPGQLVAFDLEHDVDFEPMANPPPSPGGVAEAPLPAPAHASENEHAHPLVHGRSPTEGAQVVAPTVDAGALSTNREITGMEAPAADFPIDGEPRKQPQSREKT